LGQKTHSRSAERLQHVSYVLLDLDPIRCPLEGWIRVFPFCHPVPVGSHQVDGSIII
jgi:hypothetical protein